jgi:hypothetical protein
MSQIWAQSLRSSASSLSTIAVIEEALKSLKRKKAKYSMLDELPWGKIAMIKVPSGAELSLYEPKHQLAPR